MSESVNEREYVLGTGGDELARLGLQHRLWGDAAHGAWRLARIVPGARVIDVGCGPGFAAFDLGELVRSHEEVGEVVGVDESARFIAYLNAQAAARGFSHVRGITGDVHDLRCAGAEGSFDAAYARWVLCFVKDPEAVVASAARMLKPGGRFCVHDYFNYRSMTMAPRRRSYDKAVAATVKSWEDRGGDTDIVGRLPRMMEKHGLKVTHLNVHQRLARGRDTMYTWIEVWWRVYAPKLAEMGLLTRADVDELIRDLEEVKRSGVEFVSCPPVYEVVGEKA